MSKLLTYLITKGELTPVNFQQRKSEILDKVAAAVNARVSMIQIREKAITANQLFELTRECASIAAGSETKLLVNGRADIALAAAADGVHLPEKGLPVSEFRRSIPEPFLIGASVHSVDAARSAGNDGANFVVFGPVFDSGEKHGQGINVLASVCAELGKFPVIAVGGIDANNRDQVLKAGAAGYAAIRYFDDPAVLTRLAKE
jgi:thiamine-phosphate pyrophosphorylase